LAWRAQEEEGGKEGRIDTNQETLTWQEKNSGVDDAVRTKRTFRIFPLQDIGVANI
jgi:hypothetical protein